MNELLMNTWYMGAWSHEVSDTPLSRRLLDTKIVFYRKSDQSVAALRDRCAHRFAPLSKGKIIDDKIQCPYHGLMYDSTGQCVSAPLEERAPRAIRVQSFSVIERDNIVWFWPGEPDAVDPTLIPDFSYLLDTEKFRHVFGLTHVAAHYELETDNLMDLSHTELLHPAFAGVLTPATKYKAIREGNRVRSNFFSSNVRNPPAMEHGAFPTHGALIDQWLEMRWDAPGAMYLEVAVTKAGQSREAGYTMPGVHIITPETDNSTLYFWSAPLSASETMPLDQFKEIFHHIFEHEDKPMLEQVAEAMDGESDLLSMKPLLLRTDAGAILARRVLAELIAKERRSKRPEVAAQ